MSELGTLLVRAREARGLTLEDAERDTRISRRYLQALEAEQFDAIPAPVYARGFLRSYSQYLGLDPQEMLAMFPREEDQIAAAQQAAAHSGGARPSRQQPQSAVGPARPTWRAPQPGAQTQRNANAATRQAPAEPEFPLEPVIGVDIGVPAPARRIKADPAAQTRSLTIAVVAIGAVLAVVLLAFLISNLGGGSPTPGPSASVTGAATGSAGPTTGPTLAPSGIQTTPGVVPPLTGLTAEKARAAISEAGFKSAEQHAKNAATKGTVFDQSPAAGGNLPVGKTVTIVISDGP